MQLIPILFVVLKSLLGISYVKRARFSNSDDDDDERNKESLEVKSFCFVRG